MFITLESLSRGNVGWEGGQGSGEPEDLPVTVKSFPWREVSIWDNKLGKSPESMDDSGDFF